MAALKQSATLFLAILIKLCKTRHVATCLIKITLEFAGNPSSPVCSEGLVSSTSASFYVKGTLQKAMLSA
jgi:hypothetical protein